MYGRPFAIAAAVMLLASPATAEPTPAAKPDVKPAQTLLAQASEVKLPIVKDDAAASPAKPRRAARVTTCRCADVAAQQN
jgi:hypothetical protein